MYSLLLLLHHFGARVTSIAAPLQPPTTNKFGFKYIGLVQFQLKYILVGARVTSIAAVRIV